MQSDDYWTRKIINILESPSENFEELVKISGLDPTEDFKDRDLSSIDFSNSNLESFDFTGSNLQGANFLGAKISKSKFDDKQLELRELRDSEDFRRLADFYSLKPEPSWDLEYGMSGGAKWSDNLKDKLRNLVNIDGGDVFDRRQLYVEGYSPSLFISENEELNFGENFDLGASLMKAVKERDIKSARICLNAGGSVNELDTTTDEFPIFAAIQNKQTSMINLLAQSGARFDLISPKTGMSAIHAACESQIHPIVSGLLGGSGDVDILSPAQGMTALMASASLGNLKIVRILIDAGADIHKRADDGKTALMHAVGSRRKNVVRLLLQIDSSTISATDNDGADGLSVASDLGFDDIFNILNSYGTGSR